MFETSNTPSTENCNCGKTKLCPLKNNCLTSIVVYNANVTTENETTGKNDIGRTEGTLKQRYTHTKKNSFRNRNYSNSTELSKHIWTLKYNNTSILATAWPTATKASGATYASQKNFTQLEPRSRLY